VNSVGIESFPARIAQTFGAPNAGPLIGPIVLSELMYFPAAGGDEFVEIRNISSSPVPLFDPAHPANGWKISGIGYTFPGGITLQPGQIVLLTPLTEAAWRAKYATPTAIQIFGPYAGNLDNTGERVTLQMPGVPYLNASNQTVIPYITIDSVAYKPTAPWAANAAGTGPSLERWNWRAYADDPGNWRASPTAGGSPGVPARINFATWGNLYFTSTQMADANFSGLSADPDGDGISNQMEWALGLNPLVPDGGTSMTTSIAMDGANGPYLTVQFRRSLGITPTTFELDTAADVGTWTPDGVTLGLVTNGDGTATITMRDTVPISGGTPPQRYVRLRITGN
jgi:lamin tail-like protein